VIRHLLAAVLALGLLGCAQLLPLLAQAAQGAQWIASVVDVAEGGAEAYFARHPSQGAHDTVRASVRRSRAAIAALNAAAAAGDAADAGELGRARDSALDAYRELYATLEGLGVIDAVPPPGGAETEAPVPEPLDLPSADQVAAHL